jgi:hypothetical protein
MNLHEKINENTILYYVESEREEYDEKSQTDKVTQYSLSFLFYDCQFFVSVSRKDIDQNFSYGACLEGDSTLFDSFENACQNELWETIKTKCNEFDKWQAELRS